MEQESSWIWKKYFLLRRIQHYIEEYAIFSMSLGVQNLAKKVILRMLHKNLLQKICARPFFWKQTWTLITEERLQAEYPVSLWL